MVPFRLKALVSDKNFQENQRVTLGEVSKETGIPRTRCRKLLTSAGITPPPTFSISFTDILRLC